MYKCGWNGCEKAYGTLNHLNAHVTMQSHGPKRTPEGTFQLFFMMTTRVLSAFLALVSRVHILANAAWRLDCKVPTA